MDWIGKIIGGAAGGLIESVGNVADKFHLSGEEKQQFKLEFEALLQKRDSEIEQSLRSELQAKERVLVAELQQGDNYTKRARPTVVYVGLAVIVFNYCIVPLLIKATAIIAMALADSPAAAALAGVGYEPLELPVEFWAGWSGIVMTWSIGRSAEKRGVRNKVVQAITGSRLLSALLICIAFAGVLVG
jgi:hypothetical protein